MGAPMTNARLLPSTCRLVLLGWAAALCCSGLACNRDAPPDPDAKVRLEKLLRLYQAYVNKHRKGPPDEEALRSFGQSLSPQERTDFLIGDDVEGIFTSPRDKQKYVIQFNLKLDPSGATRAVAWESDFKSLSGRNPC